MRVNTMSPTWSDLASSPIDSAAGAGAAASSEAWARAWAKALLLAAAVTTPASKVATTSERNGNAVRDMVSGGRSVAKGAASPNSAARETDPGEVARVKPGGIAKRYSRPGFVMASGFATRGPDSVRL